MKPPTHIRVPDPADLLGRACLMCPLGASHEVHDVAELDGVRDFSSPDTDDDTDGEED